MGLPAPNDELGWVQYLAIVHDSEKPQLRELDDLYTGEAPLCYLAPELLREVEDRIQVVALGWPMLAVDPLEERLDILAFRYPEEDQGVVDDPNMTRAELASFTGDANLQQVWQDNDLDEESQLGHVDALVMRRAYIAVGTNDAGDTDSPLVTVESALEVFADIDPRTRRVRAALRRQCDHRDSLVRVPEEYATLYLPNSTVWYERGDQSGAWNQIDRDDHNLGDPPIVPLTNRARLSDRYGHSELNPFLLSMSHAANKVATDMMVAEEFHALPLRALFGIGPDDLIDKSGKKLSGLQVIMGKLIAVGGIDGRTVQAHQFDPTNLANYHNTLNQLAKHVAGLIGLDAAMFGHNADANPASAEALKAREARLIKRAERKQRALGGSWEKAMRIVRRVQEGDWDPRTRRLETIWQDAATPTRSQAADAATKLLAEGISTKRQAREDIGYTPGQIRRMEAEDEIENQQLLGGKPDPGMNGPGGNLPPVPGGTGAAAG